MNTITLLILLCAVAMLFALSLVNNTARRGKILRAKHRRVRTLSPMERLALPFVLGLELLASAWHRVWFGGNRIALANELGTFNEHGIETQQIDPTSANLPVATRYLLYKRGASGDGYVDVGDATSYPLGPSADSPYAVGDFIAIRRLGARPGLEIGIPATAINKDDLVLTAASGKVQAFTGVANGTYWIVGRCVKTVAANALEVVYQPETPTKITVASGTGTYVVA